jgi:adhesin HecA-like repeat protein
MFGTTINGTASKELLPNNYSFRMTYAYASNDKKQDLNTNPVVVFQTVNAAVQLQNSQGNLIDQGTVQYYSGAWRDLGTTVNGTASKELLPNNYSFRMTYAYASNDKKQDLNTNPIVIFQTVNAAVQLQNSQGTLIDQGTVQYYSGAWREFGTTINGVANKELLPNNYSFRMTYAYASNDKKQDLNTNPIVVFQTVNAAVQLQNSQGALIDQGSVQYYSGAWREFGTTSNGAANKELLPNNYSFRMTYAYASNDKKQDLNTNPIVIFQTVNAKVQLQNSNGVLIDTGTVKYYAGAWRDLGTTINGIASKELLPNNYSFRMTYEYGSIDKKQDLSANSIVVFSTVLCTIRVKNTQNEQIDGAMVSYYSGAWRQIGLTVNGEITKELLPLNLSFRVKMGTRQQDKKQDLSTNTVVEFTMQ